MLERSPYGQWTIPSRPGDAGSDSLTLAVRTRRGPANGQPSHVDPGLRERQERHAALRAEDVARADNAGPFDAVRDHLGLAGRHEQREHLVPAGRRLLFHVLDDERLLERLPAQRYI